MRGRGADSLALADIAEAFEDRVRSGVELRWTDLRLVEIAVAEIAAEFGGEDPLGPSVREAIDATRETLEVLATLEEARGEVALREPTADEVEELRAQVRQWRTYM